MYRSAMEYVAEFDALSFVKEVCRLDIAGDDFIELHAFHHTFPHLKTDLHKEKQKMTKAT